MGGANGGAEERSSANHSELRLAQCNQQISSLFLFHNIHFAILL
jgi:hypothetical protein